MRVRCTEHIAALERWQDVSEDVASLQNSFLDGSGSDFLFRLNAIEASQSNAQKREPAATDDHVLKVAYEETIYKTYGVRTLREVENLERASPQAWQRARYGLTHSMIKAPFGAASPIANPVQPVTIENAQMETTQMYSKLRPGPLPGPEPGDAGVEPVVKPER